MQVYIYISLLKKHVSFVKFLMQDLLKLVKKFNFKYTIN